MLTIIKSNKSSNKIIGKKYLIENGSRIRIIEFVIYLIKSIMSVYAWRLGSLMNTEMAERRKYE